MMKHEGRAEKHDVDLEGTTCARLVLEHWLGNSVLMWAYAPERGASGRPPGLLDYVQVKARVSRIQIRV